MSKVLISWVGGNDLDASNGTKSGNGPILSTLKAESFDAVVLLYNYPKPEVDAYLEWLRPQVQPGIQAVRAELSSPIHFGDIYQAAHKQLEELQSQRHQICILLSPGTPAMQAVWILLGKTHFNATFYQSTKEQGVERVELPFDIAAEFIPTPKTLSRQTLQQLADTQPPVDAAFDNIITRNPQMQELIQQARTLSQHDVPVLILGESGTGKELFARAIHNASTRGSQPFVALNCGAIPPELIDSELFGHKKGAFTGAVADRAGVFEQAEGGTLFLDEFGELSPAAQVRLLRVLQDSQYVRVGDTQTRKANVRIICATNRDLLQDIQAGSFREDLLYRVAVGVLKLPALRDRGGDLMLLVEALLQGLAESGFSGKKISAGAKKVILNHRWPGNIRELRSTIQRSMLWASGDSISEHDMQQALFAAPQSQQQDSLLNRRIGEGFDIEGVLGEVAAHYIERALKESGGQKTRAAELLGFNNHQTFTNWQKKYGAG